MAPADPPLRRVLAAVHARPGARVVFDLDSTLIDNRPRIRRIVHEVGDELAAPELRAVAPGHFSDWSLIGALRRAAVPEAVIGRVHDRLIERFYERFFADEYTRFDVPLPGAAEFVAAVAGAGGAPTYVTARGAAMGPGTRATLARAGFPLADGALWLRPEEFASDDDWKQAAAARLAGDGGAAAAFENEPLHANFYRAALPEALVVLVRTNHSGRPIALADGIAEIDDFRLEPSGTETRPLG